MRGYVTRVFILLGACICLLCACSDNQSSQDKKVASLEAEIIKLKQENSQLRHLNATINNQATSETTEVMLKEIDGLPIYGSYYDNSIPAYGPIAMLNPIAINFEQTMTIIEQNDYLTKVIIEGVIPTWNLDNKPNVSFNRIHKDMYFIEDAKLYIEPQKEGHMLREITTGRAAHVLYQNNDWYYVTLNRLDSPNDIRTGWVEKDKLGSYEDFTTLLDVDVCIPLGTTLYTIDYTIDQTMLFKESPDNELWRYYSNEPGDVWGYIVEEKDTYYVISIPGASIVAIQQEDAYFGK
ncbi:hypothetical protein HZI73_12270 [Vallitalea pronyensis]|uniref:SH3 domain-containing protein n=1 Tax=Vallitalea pronyensis TaxID=1348613 RepID=A0A8J8MJW2_9FIRM|nr:hypothetical protein [Vallitalea pronyensis]QUI23019.1 hypothetical protein HZI73_12270 [Vallitalea pronyensis]